MDVNFYMKEDKEALKMLSMNKLPALKRVIICNVEDDNKDIKSFLKNSCPPALNLFCLNYMGNLIDAKHYITELKQWLKHTSDKIYLSSFKICSKDLNTIIKSSRHCKTLVINNCMIDVSEDLDFSAKSDYELENLSFQFCGKIDRSNWEDKSTELHKILLAIKNSGLIYSLKTISLHHSIISKNSYLKSLTGVRKVAQDAGLDPNLIVYEKFHPNQD